MPPTLSLALDEPTTRADWEAFARSEGWQLDRTLPADRCHGYEQIWSAPDQSLTLHYVEHALAGKAYVVLQGRGAADAARRLRAALPAMDIDETLATVRRAGSPAELTAAANGLAVLGGDSYSEPVMHALADLLRSDFTAVRSHALKAIASLGWPGLRPLVVAAALSDPDEGVREQARQIERAFAQAFDGSPDDQA